MFSVTYPEQTNEAETNNETLIQMNIAPNVFDSLNEQSSPIANKESKSDSETTQRNSNYASYICIRSHRLHMNSRILFSFESGNKTILFAKSRGQPASSVYISSNQDIHIKSKQYEYVLYITNHSKNYVLKEINSDEDLMIIKMDNDYGVEYGPRKIQIFWPKDNLKHVSRMPKRDKNGDWKLNFGTKYVLASVKNAIILDENVKPALLVRKIDKEKLQIEVIRKYKPIYLFSIAIASFICPF